MQFFCEWLLPEYWNLLEFQQNSIASILYFNKNPVFLNSYFKIVIDLFLNILIHSFIRPIVPFDGSILNGGHWPASTPQVPPHWAGNFIISKAGTSFFAF